MWSRDMRRKEYLRFSFEPGTWEIWKRHMQWRYGKADNGTFYLGLCCDFALFLSDWFTPFCPFPMIPCEKLSWTSGTFSGLNSVWLSIYSQGDGMGDFWCFIRKLYFSSFLYTIILLHFFILRVCFVFM